MCSIPLTLWATRSNLTLTWVLPMNFVLVEALVEAWEAFQTRRFVSDNVILWTFSFLQWPKHSSLSLFPLLLFLYSQLRTSWQLVDYSKWWQTHLETEWQCLGWLLCFQLYSPCFFDQLWNPWHWWGHFCDHYGTSNSMSAWMWLKRKLDEFLTPPSFLVIFSFSLSLSRLRKAILPRLLSMGRRIPGITATGSQTQQCRWLLLMTSRSCGFASLVLEPFRLFSTNAASTS